MSESKKNHKFTVNLEGLNLSDEQLARITTAVQKAVMTELASVDLNLQRGGLLANFGPIWRGIIYFPDLQKIKNLEKA